MGTMNLMALTFRA